MTFSENVYNGTRKKCLHFGGDPYTLSLVTTLAVCPGGVLCFKMLYLDQFGH